MKTLPLFSALKDVIAACQNDLEVIKERQAAIKAQLDNAAALGIDPAAVRRFLRKADRNDIDRDRNDEIDTIYRVIANDGVPVLPSRSDSELDSVLALTNTDKPPKIAAIRQAIGCSQGKAQKLRTLAAARLAAKSLSSREMDEDELLTKQDRRSDGSRLGELEKAQLEPLEPAAAKTGTLPHEPETGDIAAKSSSSRGIDEHELLTKQDRPSDGPQLGELQQSQIEPLERAAAKTATLPHEPETGEIVEPRNGADDDALEIPNFLKRPPPGRMATP
jgi:hypothetical protein